MMKALHLALLLLLCSLPVTVHAQELALTATATPSSCLNNGTITISYTGSPAPATWGVALVPYNPANVISGSSPVFTDLPPGDYLFGYFNGSMFVPSDAPVRVANTYSSISPTFDAVQTNAYRYAYCGTDVPLGYINTRVNGGNAPYTITLTQNGTVAATQVGNAQGFASFRDLPAGTYTLSAMDACGTIVNGPSLDVLASIPYTTFTLSGATNTPSESAFEVIYNVPGDVCSGIASASIKTLSFIVGGAVSDVTTSSSTTRFYGTKTVNYKLEIQNESGGFDVYDNLPNLGGIFPMPTDRDKWGIIRLTVTICGIERVNTADLSAYTRFKKRPFTNIYTELRDDPANTACSRSGKVLLSTDSWNNGASLGCEPYAIAVTEQETGIILRDTIGLSIGKRFPTLLLEIGKTYTISYTDAAGDVATSYFFYNKTTSPAPSKPTAINPVYLDPALYGPLDPVAAIEYSTGLSPQYFGKSALVFTGLGQLTFPVTISTLSGPDTITRTYSSIGSNGGYIGVGNSITPGTYRFRVQDAVCFDQEYDIVLDSYIDSVTLENLTAVPATGGVCDRYTKQGTVRVTVVGNYLPASGSNPISYLYSANNTLYPRLLSGPAGLTVYRVTGGTPVLGTAGSYNFAFAADIPGDYDVALSYSNSSNALLLPAQVAPGTVAVPFTVTPQFPTFDLSASGGTICDGAMVGDLTVKVDNAPGVITYFLKLSTDANYPATGQTSPVFAGLPPGNYDVKAVTTCYEVVQSFRMANAVSGDIITGATQYCSDDTLVLSTLPVGPVTSTVWTLPDGTTVPAGVLTIPNLTATQSGAYRVVVTTTAGCTFDQSVTITVTDRPAAPTGDSPQTACSVPGEVIPTIADLVASGTNIVWYSMPTGGTVLPTTTVLVNTTTYYVASQSGTCESATRLPVLVEIKPYATAAHLGVSGGGFCSGGTATFTATTSVVTHPVFNWYEDITLLNKVGTGPTFTTPPLTANRYYYATVQGDEVCENNPDYATTQPNRVSAVLNPLATAADITADNVYVCYGEQGTFTASSTTVINPVFRWYRWAPGYVLLHTGDTFTPDEVPDATHNWPYVVTVSGDNKCEKLVTPTVGADYKGVSLVGKRPSVASDIQVAPQAICPGGTATLTASSTTVVNNPIIKWYSDAALGTANELHTGAVYEPSPTINTTYYVTIQSPGACENLPGAAKEATVTVYPNPPTPIGNAMQSFCEGATVANLVTNATTIMWYDGPDVGVGMPLAPTTVLVDGQTYYGAAVENTICESEVRLAVTASINRTATAADIQGDDDGAICAGESFGFAVYSPTVNLATFTWYDDAALTHVVGTGFFFTAAPAATTTYYVTVRGENVCANTPATAKAIILTVIPLPAGAPTGVAVQAFCTGAVVPNLVTDQTNVVWYNIPVGGAQLTEVTLLEDGAIYYGALVNSGTRCESVARLAVTARILPVADPPIVALPERYFCTGTGVRFNATSPLTNPIYTWYDDAALTNVVFTPNSFFYTPALTVNTTYYVTVQNADTCESPAVTVQAIAAERPLASDIITQNEVQACGVPFPSTVTLTASVGPEFTEVYWYSNAALTNLVNTGPEFIVPVVYGQATRSYWVATTRTGNSNCQNSPSEAQRVSVYALGAYGPDRITVTGNRPLCLGETQELVATATSDTGTETGIKWYSDPSLDPAFLVHDGTNFTPLLTETTTFYVQLIGFAYCPNEPGNGKVVTVVANPHPGEATGAPDQRFCPGARVSDLVTDQAGVVWYAAATGGTVLNVATALVSGTTYYGAIRQGNCESLTRLPVAVTINRTATAADITQLFDVAVCSGTGVDMIANTTTVTNPVFTWYSDPALTTIVSTTDYFGTPPLTNTTTYYVTVQGYGVCENTAATAKIVIITVNPNLPTPTGAATQTFCIGATVSDLVTTEPNVVWFSNDTGGAPLPGTTLLADSATYYGALVNSGTGCESVIRLAVQVTIRTAPTPPTGSSPQLFCAADAPTVADLVTSPTNVVWYAAAVGGDLLSDTTLLIDGTSYYAAQLLAGCESLTRLEVVANFKPLSGPADIQSSSIRVCEGQIGEFTASSLTVINPVFNWYIDNFPNYTLVHTGSTFIPPNPGNSSVADYYYISVSGDNKCENPVYSGMRTVVRAVSPYMDASNVIVNDAVGCVGRTVSVLIQTTISGGDIRVYSDAALTDLLYDAYAGAIGTTFTTPVLNSDTTYYATTYSNIHCENLPGTAKPFTVRLNPTPAAPTGDATQYLCPGATVADLVANEANVAWYYNMNGLPPLDPTEMVYNGQTVYGAISDPVTGCRSDYLPVTIVINPRATAADITASDASVCAGNTVTIPIQTTTNGTIRVYSDAALTGLLYEAYAGAAVVDFVTPVLNSDTVFYITTYGDRHCENTAATAKVVTITVSPLVAPPTGAATQAFCTGGTVSDLVTTEPNIVWFSTPTGGLPLAATTLLVDTDFYYGALIDTGTGCESATRLAVEVQLTPDAATPVFALGATSSICAGATETYTATAANSTGISYSLTPPVAGIIDPVTGLVSWESGFSGTATITAEAAGCNGPTSAVHTVTVIDPVAAPVFDRGATSEICGDPGTIVYNYNAVDPYGRTVTYTMSPSGPTVGNINSTTGNVIWIYEVPSQSYYFSGDVTITATVTGCNGTPITTTHIVSRRNKSSTVYFKGKEVMDATPLRSICQGEASSLFYAVTGRRGGDIVFTISPPEAGTIVTLPLENMGGGYGYQSSAEVTWNTSFYGLATITGTTYGCEGAQQSADNIVTVRARVDSVAFDLGATSSICTGVTQLYYAVGNNEVPVSGYTISPAAAGTITSYAGGATIRWNTTFSGDAVITATATGCNGTASGTHTVTVIPLPGAPTGGAAQTFCAAAAPTVAQLAATGNNIQWYTSYTGSTLLDPATALVNGALYYASQTDAVTGCESTARLVVNVSLTVAPALPTGSSPQLFCAADAPAVADLVTSPTNVVWYDAAVGGNLLPDTTLLTDGTPYYAAQLLSGCESVNRLQVVANFKPLAENFTDIDIEETPIYVCDGEYGTFRASSTTVINPVFRWYEFGIGGALLHTGPEFTPPDPATITKQWIVTVAGDNKCEALNSSQTKTVVRVYMQNPAADAITAADQAICRGTTAVVPITIDSAIILPTTRVYTTADLDPANKIAEFAVHGNPAVFTTPVLTATTTYYITTSGSSYCESKPATAKVLTITVHDIATPTTGDPTQEFCVVSAATIADLQVDQTNIVWYDAATAGNSLPVTTVLADGGHYFAALTDGSGCESTVRLDIEVLLNDTPAPTAVSPQRFCSGYGFTIGDIVVAGTDVLFYSTSTGGTPLDPTAAVNQRIYYASQTIGGCESSVRTNIQVYIIPTANEGMIQSDPVPPVCYGASADLSVRSNFVTSPKFKWYTDNTLATLLHTGPDYTTPPILTTTSFFVTVQDTVAGLCENIPGRAFELVVNVKPYAVAADITAAGASICRGSATTLVAGSAIPNAIFKWYSDAALTLEIPADGSDPTGATLTVSPIATTTYYATVSGDGYCENEPNTGKEVIVNVTDIATPTTGDTTQEFCLISAPTIADLQVDQTNIVWYDAATAGNSLPVTTVLTDGVHYFAALTDVGGCESTVRLDIEVILNDAATPTTTDPTQEFCVINAPTVANLQVNETNVTWYDLPTGGTIIAPTTALTVGGIYYASLTDASGCESSVRLAITVILNDAATPTATDPTQEFCVINAPTVADLQVNETNITWYDLPTGGTILPPTTALTDGGIYYASLTDASGCESSVRLAITVILNDAATPTTADTTQEFCVINAPTVADLQVNETNVTWYDLPTGGTMIAPTTALTDGGIYYASLTDASGCESSVRLAITVILNDAATPTTADTTQEFCVINAPTVADLQVNETNITWYTAMTGGTIVPPITVLTDGGIYYASLTDASSCESSVRLAITVILNDAATPTTADTTQEFCVINAPRVADLQVNETNITWYTAMTGGTIMPPTTALTDGGIYYASLTDASGCESSVRLPITVILNDAATPTTADTTQEFCVINAPTVADLQVNETNITWYDLPTGGTIIAPTTALTDGGIYYASLTDVSGCASSVRLAITVILNDAATPTTTDLTQEFCVINTPTVANLQVNEMNVTWYDLPTGGTIIAPTTALTDGGIYYASLTDASGCESSVRLAITVILNDVATPTTADTTQEFCLINAPTVANLQVNETNITWYDLPTGGIIIAPTTALTDGGIYYASLTDANGCESSVRLAITVILNDAATPTTADTTQEFCVINAPTVANLQVNETNVTWYDLPTGGTIIAPTTALTDGGIYYASLTDANGCESSVRLAITVILNDAATPTTADTTQEFCVINAPTVADLQVNETNVTWYTATTGGTIIPPTTALTDGGVYYASLTDAGGCASSVRLPITVILNDAATPTTTDPTQEFCVINTPTVANLQVNETNVTWYDALTGSTILPPTTALTDGGIYYASLTDASSCESSVRLAITVILNDAATPTTTDPTQEFCVINAPTVANLQVNETNITWYDLPTGGTIIAPTTALTDGGIYYASLTDASSCESSVRLAITVILNDAGTPTTADTTQEFCVINAPRVADLQVNETNITWYTAMTGGTIVLPTTALTDGGIYYASLTDASSCESSVRLAITVILNDAATPTTTDPTQEFCVINAPTVADLQVNETNITWYDLPTGGTIIAPTTALTDGGIYYASLTDASGCASSIRLALTVILNDAATPTTADTTQEFCVISAPTVADLQVNETNITWYNLPTGGTIIAPTTALTDGGIYYASLTDASGCESSVRLTITVILNDAATPTTADTTQEFCVINAPRVADLQVNETNITWYTAMTGGTIVLPTTALTDGGIYYASLTDASGCASSVRLAITVILNNTAPPTGAATQSFCTATIPTVVNLVATGDAIQWYASATGGTALDPATVLVQGATYYASQTAGGCESTQRLAVMVTLTPAAWAALIGVDPVTICVDETAVLTASTLVPNPVFTWYADSNLITVLGTGAQLTVSPVVTTTYYVTVAGDGYCENTPGTAQTATVTVNRKATAADITIADRYVCTGDTVLLTASGTVVSPVYTWYADPELTQLLHTGATYSVAPATTVTYYIAVSGYDVCSNDPYTGKPITLTVAHVPTPTTNDPIQSFCGIDYPTVADLQVNATNVNWYAAPTGGTALPLDQLLTDGTVYYATELDLVSGCESEIRLEVTAVLRTDLPGDTSGWNPEACVLETVTYTTVAGMSDYDWFVTGGTILGGGELTDNYVTVQWITAGAGTVSVAYVNAANCDPIVQITFGVTITLCGDIAITKTVDASSTVAVGDTVVFTIAAANLGTVAFTDVVINETLPDGYTFVQAFSTGGSYNPLTGLWTIAQLEGGETLTLKVTAIVKGSGDYLNVAYLESSFPEDPNPGNNRDEATITVSGIVIYNGLSPNGDGQNDYFNIEGLERYPNNSVEIFNRYGARIYHTNGYNSNGNVFRGISEGKGTISKGEVVPAGTYFYVLKYETPHGGTVERSGYLYVTP